MKLYWRTNFTFTVSVTEEKENIESHLSHIESVTVGETPTVASKIRALVMTHPLYKHDSVVSPKVAQDVIRLLCRNAVASVEV